MPVDVNECQWSEATGTFRSALDGRSFIIPFGFGAPGVILAVRGVRGGVGAAVVIRRELAVRI